MNYLNIKTYSQAFRMTYIMFIIAMILILSTNISISSNLNNLFHEPKNFLTDKINIKSVIIHRLGFELSDPVIQLNSDEKLFLSFDDLDDQVKSYTYKIQHCNSNWEPSELIYSEYIDGFITDQINEYNFSLNTTTSYIHYELTFPTDYLRITKSGNYIISVFGNDSEAIPSFSRKFNVVDPKIKIEASIKPPLSVKFKKDKQEIGFKIFLNSLYVPNPESSLKIVIQQNHQTNNQITDLKPVRNLGDVLDYNFNNKSVFYGGNEFRPLNIKSLKYKSERIKAIDFLRDGYHVLLYEDQARGQSNYIHEYDINGQKLIKTEDEENSATEANYCWIHFKLQAKSHLLDKIIYLTGKLTEGLSDGDTQMIYNADKNIFEGQLFLKQGYYDYQYFVKGQEESSHNITLTEGSFYETQNEYSIFVYYWEPGTVYDQLIGFETIIGPIN